MAMPLGHCHPRVVEAFRDQAGELTFTYRFSFRNEHRLVPEREAVRERQLTGLGAQGLDDRGWQWPSGIAIAPPQASR